MSGKKGTQSLQENYQKQKEILENLNSEEDIEAIEPINKELEIENVEDTEEKEDSNLFDPADESYFNYMQFSKQLKDLEENLKQSLEENLNKGDNF